MQPSDVLVLPGWGSSGPLHWQTIWERLHGYRQVEQHDWMTPLRGDWVARLEDVLLGCERPVVLVAHSLGCIQVAAWAAHSANATRVKAAFLVAPGDVEREDIRAQIPTWYPIERKPLPFPSMLLGSRDDPYCTFERARELARAWGARFIDYGEAGHINADSALGDWPEGHELLQELMQEDKPW